MRKAILCCCFFLITGCTPSLIYKNSAYKSEKYIGKKLLVLPVSRDAIKLDENRHQYVKALKISDDQIEDTLKSIFNKYLIGYPVKYIKKVTVIDNRGETPISFKDSSTYKFIPVTSRDNYPMKVKIPLVSGFDLKGADFIVCITNVSVFHRDYQPGISNSVFGYTHGGYAALPDDYITSKSAAFILRINYVLYDIDKDKIVSAGELVQEQKYLFNLKIDDIKNAFKYATLSLFFNTPFKIVVPQS